jgi:hypothetical protein
MVKKINSDLVKKKFKENNIFNVINHKGHVLGYYCPVEICSEVIDKKKKKCKVHNKVIKFGCKNCLLNFFITKKKLDEIENCHVGEIIKTPKGNIGY